jgi:serine phosphatase RsbU (regulator of sigma subunit)/pSer/pThr/pTyr-binding forkhead associated (FHA) protein
LGRNGGSRRSNFPFWQWRTEATAECRSARSREFLLAHLRFFEGNRPQRVELTGNSYTIGRHRECQVILDNDAVSRRHAHIVRKGDAYFLEDLGSRNRTYLNGNLVQGPTVLGDNDIIRVCNYNILFLTDTTDDSRQQIVIVGGKEDSTRIKALRDTVSSGSDLGLVEDARPREKLESLREISRTLVAVLRVDEMTGRVLDSLFRIFPQCDRGYILLKSEDGREAIPRAIKNRRDDPDPNIRISRTVLNQVLGNCHAIIAEDATIDAKLAAQGSIADNFIHSIMCVPLIVRGSQPIGAIWLHTEDRRRQFKEEDLDLLVSVAGMVGVALERALLHEDLLLQDRIKNEILTGRKIQQTFLPIDWPFVHGYRFHADYEPAQSVGGDFYGFIHLPNERIVITLGDVAGKGMSAAMLMARLTSELRFAAINNPDPAAAVRSLNRIIEQEWPGDRFVTLLYMLLDLQDHSMSLVNAGHMPPLFRGSAGQVLPVAGELSGPPLNTASGYDYEAVTLTFKHGGTILAYTDGVTDARNLADASFGMDRLIQAYQDAPTDPTQAGAAVIQAVRRFADGCPQFDDIAMICFGREEE